MAIKNDINWHELSWETKVQLCEQSRANENSQLQSYRVIFIAIESILFAVVFGVAWKYLIIVFCLSVLGIFLTVVWWHITKIRGEAGDHWERMLYELWIRVDRNTIKSSEKKIISQIIERYKGATFRWETKYSSKSKKEDIKFKRIEIIKSARWWLNEILPLLTFIAWITVIVFRSIG